MTATSEAVVDGNSSTESSAGLPESGGDSLLRRLAQPTDLAGLIVCRIALGLAVASFAFGFLSSSALEHDFIAPAMHLKYHGFGWVRVWPGNGMHFHFVVMMLAGLGVALGLFYRVAAVVLFVTFTHVFLVERAIYNNHYYLISLLTFLICFMPLHRAFSLDVLRRGEPASRTIPVWMLWLFRFQLGIVYFYGGIAKLNADWLSGQPMRLWLAAQTHYPGIGHLFTEEWMVQVFVWGGILIDLLAAPCLLWRRTRTFMFCALLLFHLMNSTLFHIGVFPWLMMALTTLFFRPDWPRRLFRVSRQSGVAASEPCSLSRTQGILLSLYVLIQITLPLRHFPTGEDPSWTERGHQFAWRMMLREKQTGIRFIATEVATGRTGEVDVRPYLTARQAAQISRNPDLAVQFAHWLADEFRRMGLGDTEIRAKCLVSLNGRRPQLLFDPTVDLASEPRRLGGYPWILPLTEPLRHDAWDVPLAEWEQMPELSSLANDAVSVAAEVTSRKATP